MTASFEGHERVHMSAPDTVRATPTVALIGAGYPAADVREGFPDGE